CPFAKFPRDAASSCPNDGVSSRAESPRLRGPLTINLKQSAHNISWVAILQDPMPRGPIGNFAISKRAVWDDSASSAKNHNLLYNRLQGTTQICGMFAFVRCRVRDEA